MMQFTKIDINNWTRKEYFDHYFDNTPCTYSMTVKLDISKLKKDGKKLYPTLLYGVTTILNRHEEFRTALDKNGQVGVFSEMLPCYTIFHKETETFSSIQKRLKEAQELSDLKDENMALEYELNRQKDLMARLMQRVEAALTFLEEKLPEQFRPYVQRARAHIMPEPKQEHRHDRGMSMGGMSR